MVQSPSWEGNWFAASQEIPRISQNPKVHYRTHKRPPPIYILGQPNLPIRRLITGFVAKMEDIYYAVRAECIKWLRLILVHHHHHNHHVPEGLGVFPVPWSSRWSWSLHLFLGRPMFLRPFGLYCSACFGILFVSILCTCCSHFFWYCFISFTMFFAPVFFLPNTSILFFI